MAKRVYIDEFTEFELVFGNMKRTRVSRRHVKDLDFTDITRGLKYVRATDSFVYNYHVKEFKISFRGTSRDIKSLDCQRIVFYKDGEDIGNMRLDKSVTPVLKDDLIELRSWWAE